MHLRPRRVWTGLAWRPLLGSSRLPAESQHRAGWSHCCTTAAAAAAATCRSKPTKRVEKGTAAAYNPLIGMPLPFRTSAKRRRAATIGFCSGSTLNRFIEKVDATNCTSSTSGESVASPQVCHGGQADKMGQQASSAAGKQCSNGAGAGRGGMHRSRGCRAFLTPAALAALSRLVCPSTITLSGACMYRHVTNQASISEG